VHTTGQRANTRMNVSKYKASGMTQKNGIAAMSVVKYVVSPSMRLEGAAASPIQRKRRNQVMFPDGAAVAGGTCGAALAWVSVTRRPGPRLAVIAVSTFTDG